MAEREADTVVILSSELISKITEEYFNKTMFKQKVEIVDLKPTETGYMFSVAFTSKEVKKEAVLSDVVVKSTEEEFNESISRLAQGTMARLRNGQFAKVKERVNG